METTQYKGRYQRIEDSVVLAGELSETNGIDPLWTAITVLYIIEDFFIKIKKEDLDEDSKIIWDMMLHLVTSNNSDRQKGKGLEVMWSNLHDYGVVAAGEEDVATVIQNLLKYFRHKFPAVRLEVITEDTVLVTKLRH